MQITPVRITGTPEWKALADNFAKLRDVHLREFFDESPGRGESMTVEAADLVLDYSKNRLTPETVRLLVAVAERAGLRERAQAMFSGEHINVTEDRAVLHVALRAPSDV
jgi:glucose-6-phosphate isomerase